MKTDDRLNKQENLIFKKYFENKNLIKSSEALKIVKEVFGGLRKDRK